MNKILMVLAITILLAGCIAIKREENAIGKGKINLSFGLKETTEKTETAEISDKPDLEITHIYWSTLFPDVNENGELNMRVINNGNAPVNGFNYKITVFNSYDVWKEESHEYEGILEPGDKIKLTKTFSFNESDQFKAEAYLDWDNSIKEHNELNNYKQTHTLTASEGEQEEAESEEPGEVNITLGENKCVDSDDGINYHKKGRCIDNGPFMLGMNDYCKNKFTLIELYCINQTQRCKFAEPYECYCKDGACV